MHYRSFSKTDIPFPYCRNDFKGTFPLGKMKAAIDKEIFPFHPLNILCWSQELLSVFLLLL